MRKLLALVCLLVGAAAAQQTCPISVRATVADRAGMVMDLQAADFSMKLDGREVPVKSAEVKPTPHVFVVLDASGSMVDTSGRGNRKWHAMLAQATSKLFRKLHKAQQLEF